MIEAEDIILNGYGVQGSGAASGGEYASLFNGTVEASPNSGELQYTFDGERGVYAIEVFVFDENDGSSPITVRVNGAVVGSHIMDEQLGTPGVSAANLTSFILTDVILEDGDVVTFQGSRDAGRMGAD